MINKTIKQIGWEFKKDSKSYNTYSASLVNGNEKVFVCWLDTKVDLKEKESKENAMDRIIVESGWKDKNDLWNWKKENNIYNHFSVKEW